MLSCNLMLHEIYLLYIFKCIQKAVYNVNTHKYRGKCFEHMTHEASKLLIPLRSTVLLLCPADQSSSTSKSVHWNSVDPRLPEHPVWQTKLPGSPIKVCSAIVLSLQKTLPLCQAMRWVTTTCVYETCMQLSLYSTSYKILGWSCTRNAQ